MWLRPTRALTSTCTVYMLYCTSEVQYIVHSHYDWNLEHAYKYANYVYVRLRARHRTLGGAGTAAFQTVTAAAHSLCS